MCSSVQFDELSFEKGQSTVDTPNSTKLETLTSAQHEWARWLFSQSQSHNLGQASDQ